MKRLRFLYRFYARIYNLFVHKNKKLTYYFFFSKKQLQTIESIDGFKPMIYFKGKVYTQMVSIFEKYKHCNNDYAWNNWDDAKLLGMGNYHDIEF